MRKKIDITKIRHIMLIFALIIPYSLAESLFAYNMSNSYFNVSTGIYGEISSLKITGDAFPTNYVLNPTSAPQQNNSSTEHYWLGELMFNYRLGTGAWTKAYSNYSSDTRTQSQSGNTITITYQNSSNANGIKNFKVVETYSLVNDYLLWSIEVTNTSSQTLELGDFGLPLAFNHIWPSGVVYETQVVYHSFTGKNSSYITVTRPSGMGNFLLMVPDATTGAGFEYMDHWRVQEHSGSMWAQDQGGWANGLNVFYIHSNVIKSTNRGYLPNTSLTLAPNANKTYAFKFFKVASDAEVKDRLYSEGLIDVTALPGMIIPTNMDAKVDLHTSKTITSITVPSGATMTYLNTVATDHKIYSLKLTTLGQNNITVNYGNNETTTLQFYAIEPIADALQRHATFMVQKTQVNDTSKFYDKIFDDWMMDTKSRRDSFNGYMSGWGDDWGMTHGTFLAEKNAQTPVASEILALDQYLERGIWNGLMKDNHSDYKVHDWYLQPFYTDDLNRAFAYPHISNTYLAMYKIMKRYPTLVSYINSRTTNLLRAYNIYMVGARLSVGTGLMGESTAPELIQALKDEGYTTEANNVVSIVNTKYNSFRNQTYPYGSEYNYDNTGEEGVYTYAKANNNTIMMSKINVKTRACRGQQPVWYYYADPVTICGEAWWDFQYSVSLIGYCMDDWLRYHSTTPELDARLTYAAKIANIGCINSGQIDSDPANIGTVAWTYQSEKGNIYGGSAEGGRLHNGWRQMSGEADLGLFGAIRILSSDVAVDPIFGLFGYGCDVSENGSNYVVTPRDGVFKKLNLLTQKLYMELEQDQYTVATVSKNKNFLDFTLKNLTPTMSHTTRLFLTGLAAGTYNVLVNGSATGSFTAAANQTATISLSIGTQTTYSIQITIGTVTPTPTPTATPTPTPTTPTPTPTINQNPIWSGGPYTLNGTSDYIDLPDGLTNNLSDFSVACWVNTNSVAAWTRVFDIGVNTNSYMFLAVASDTGYPRFAITTGGNSSEQVINGTSVLPTGSWQHLAVVKNGNTGILYISKQEVGRNTSMSLRPLDLGNTINNYIGKSQYTGDPYLDGSVSNFAVYDRALSAAEVTALGNTPPGGLKGDVNGDGNVNIVDAMLIAQYVSGLNPAGFNKNNADANCDSNININDALLVARYAAGLIPNLGC